MEITALKLGPNRGRAEIITDLWPHGLTAQGRDARVRASVAR